MWFAADSLEPGASQFTSAVLSGGRSLRPLNASDNHQVHDDPVCGSYCRIKTCVPCPEGFTWHETRFWIEKVRGGVSPQRSTCYLEYLETSKATLRTQARVAWSSACSICIVRDRMIAHGRSVLGLSIWRIRYRKRCMRTLPTYQPRINKHRDA